MKQLSARTIQTQLSGEDIFIDVGLLRWLNEQSGSVARDNWLLEACLFFLIRIRVHERIRLDEDGHIHRRFWKVMEKSLRLERHGKHTKTKNIFIYCFLEQMAMQKQWIQKDGKHAFITRRGDDYLKENREKQLNELLGYLWPKS
ncbi:hypothetical protein CHL76_05980 [Marinococcus halophilus]|uniref:Uncharacterized protein n=1 Tax=Marinococcus halophilus TaxID=1371 RepID=A0A510Y3M5_MARHA|nr:hypothetical protein [Marinococcus halophilus]OZT80876.1 hypothetical protein CHL76_05980 [Marinococcus halophilus]GEK57932.1 hypothetical protein MHA01_08370 [Marinococcus halophilus]